MPADAAPTRAGSVRNTSSTTPRHHTQYKRPDVTGKQPDGTGNTGDKSAGDDDDDLYLPIWPKNERDAERLRLATKVPSMFPQSQASRRGGGSGATSASTRRKPQGFADASTEGQPSVRQRGTDGGDAGGGAGGIAPRPVRGSARRVPQGFARTGSGASGSTGDGGGVPLTMRKDGAGGGAVQPGQKLAHEVVDTKAPHVHEPEDYELLWPKDEAARQRLATKVWHLVVCFLVYFFLDGFFLFSYVFCKMRFFLPFIFPRCFFFFFSR